MKNNIDEHPSVQMVAKKYEKLTKNVEVYKSTIESWLMNKNYKEIVQFYNYICAMKKIGEQLCLEDTTYSDIYLLFCNSEIIKSYKEGKLVINLNEGESIYSQDDFEINYTIQLKIQRDKDKKNPLKQMFRHIRG